MCVSRVEDELGGGRVDVGKRPAHAAQPRPTAPQEASPKTLAVTGEYVYINGFSGQVVLLMDSDPSLSK